MTVYVFDSSALIRYLDDEAGAKRVEQILGECIRQHAAALVSAIQWGEVAGNMRKRFGEIDEMRVLNTAFPSELTIVPVTAERAKHAADLRVDRKIAYADAFALDLAMESPSHLLITADYGFKDVEDIARIEFLPQK
jgi:predicted nucleic acid-binding protein